MQNNRNLGITLIEVIIVLAIVAIVTATSAPYFGDLIDKRRLIGAGETLFSDLRLAQSESIKRNQTIFVSFKKTGDNWCYGMNEGSECDCQIPSECKIDNIRKVKTNENFKNITLQKARFAGNRTYTAFDPLKGYAQANGVKNGSIWLQSTNGTQLALIINRLGRVRFCSPTLPNYSRQCPTLP